MKQELFITFKKAYNSVSREVFLLNSEYPRN